MKLPAGQKHASPSGFTLAELLSTITFIALVATVSIISIKNTTSVNTVKLKADVRNINQLITTYLASGGDLSNVSTAQGALDKLKTTISTLDAQQSSLSVTGRLVDVRLAALPQTATEAATQTLRAIWNSTTKQFTVATTGSGGIAKFYLDDALASNTYATETRTRSAKLYNGMPGWVWAGNSSNSLSPLSAMEANGINYFTLFSPLPAGTGNPVAPTGGGGPAPSTLPNPIINPKGGGFYQAFFPSLVSIDPNGASSSVSSLQYRRNGGGWETYYGPFSVAPRDKIEAKCVAINPTLYNDSQMVTESYYVLLPNLSGTIVAFWYPSTGPSGMRQTINNTDPTLVTEVDGTAASGYTTGPNFFSFAPVLSFTNIAPNTQFRIGTLTYKNGTINSGTGATALNLHIDLSLSAPLIPTAGIENPLDLTNTVNNTNTQTGDADSLTLAAPTTSWSITQAGVVYTLKLALANVDNENGWTTGNITLNVYEGATASVDIMATFVTTP